MQIVTIGAHPFFVDDRRGASASEVEESLNLHVFNSAPKNIGRQLVRRGLASSFVEWGFWGFPTRELRFHGTPMLMFHTRDPEDTSSLEEHVARKGQPDIIWVGGLAFSDLLRRVFAVCPDSLKLIYPKYCEPWLIEGLDQYDACLVDEKWQMDEMRRRHPRTRCFIWDKLVDFDQFLPLSVSKRYDVCYVARLDPRKNHELLFAALGKLRERRLSAVLVGTNENRCQQYLEPMALEAGVDATFTGHVPPEEVNRFINQSRIGVICDRHDAVPRAMLEYMAADVPVVVNAEMQAGIRYIAPKAGMLISPSWFHDGIREVLDHLDSFRAREHLIEHYSNEKVTDKFWGFVQDLLSHKRSDSAPNDTARKGGSHAARQGP